MLDPQASRFWQATLHSGLMDVEGLTVCWNAIPPGKRSEPEHIDRRLARQAVQAKVLTIWQAQQLLAGRTAGFKVDRYVLLDLIGQGGMGRVYLAMDSRLNRRVALKILSPERINNPRAIARFQREARVGAQLQHENLVRIYDFGESNGRYFLVMEYIEGKTIGTLISEQGPMPPATAVRLLRQVAMGLEHAHRKGLIHRDVNPYNILVTHDGTAKLADLGLALDLAEEDRVTREGATVGTFDYVAPEQARHSHAADIRSDIYSLGCTLYHMLSGHVPFPSPSLPEKLFSHQALEPVPLEKVIPGLPPGLTDVIRRMMRKSPDERYATPLHVSQALEPFEEDEISLGDHNGSPPLVQNPQVHAGPLADGSETRAVSEAALGSVRSVASTTASKPPAGSAADSGSEPEGVEPGEPLLSPANDVDAAKAGNPLLLDLGPAPLLSEGLSGSKSRTVSDHSTSVAGVALPAWLPRQWFWGLVAVTVTVIGIVAILGVLNPFGTIARWNSPGRSSTEDPATKSDQKSRPGTSPGIDQSKRGLKDKSDFVVRFDGENDEGTSVATLADAMRNAIGSHGWVELRNRQPLRLTSDQILDFQTGRGTLSIRAAAGIEPVIEIELKGSKPLLATGSGVVLELSGVTIVAKYSQPKPGAATTPPPVISTAGKARISRCAFIMHGGLRIKDSQAIFSNGGSLDVDRCWFEGFDKAIQLVGIETNLPPPRLRQTMIVPGPAARGGQPPELYGWAVNVRSVRGPKREPHLIFEHCTIEGAGVLDLVNMQPGSALQVGVNNCVLRANALVACRPDTSTAQQIKAQVSWRGASDQYDILGRYWIVLSANEDGTPAFSTAVTDVAGWWNIFGSDKNPITSAPKYEIDPAMRANPLRPGDFAISASGLHQPKPGADFSQVGPWSRP
jgi:serine/threonine-protein kinase